MATFIIAFCILLAIIAAMSIGVLMGRKPITGSCGGVGAALGEEDYVCELCGGDEAKCVESKLDTEDGHSNSNDKAMGLAYDATEKQSSIKH